jgi:hypothetical protein
MKLVLFEQPKKPKNTEENSEYDGPCEARNQTIIKIRKLYLKAFVLWAKGGDVTHSGNKLLIFNPI